MDKNQSKKEKTKIYNREINNYILGVYEPNVPISLSKILAIGKALGKTNEEIITDIEKQREKILKLLNKNEPLVDLNEEVY